MWTGKGFSEQQQQRCGSEGDSFEGSLALDGCQSQEQFSDSIVLVVAGVSVRTVEASSSCCSLLPELHTHVLSQPPYYFVWSQSPAFLQSLPV